MRAVSARLPCTALACVLGAVLATSRGAVAAGMLPLTQTQSAAPEKTAAAPAGQLRTLRQNAEKGNAEAQYRLAVALRTGAGVTKDDAEAVKWYRAAADQGHAGAQNNLGWMYYSGSGVSQDDAQAASWFRKAAEQGNADSQYNLGTMCLTGRGVPRSDAEAVRWFRLAAEQGDAGALYSVGVMYERGLGVNQDNVEAHVWYELAATRASAEARKKYATARDRIAAKLTADEIAQANNRLKARADELRQQKK